MCYLKMCYYIFWKPNRSWVIDQKKYDFCLWSIHQEPPAGCHFNAILEFLMPLFCFTILILLQKCEIASNTQFWLGAKLPPRLYEIDLIEAKHISISALIPIVAKCRVIIKGIWVNVIYRSVNKNTDNVKTVWSDRSETIRKQDLDSPGHSTTYFEVFLISRTSRWKIMKLNKSIQSSIRSPYVYIMYTYSLSM